MDKITRTVTATRIQFSEAVVLNGVPTFRPCEPVVTAGEIPDEIKALQYLRKKFGTDRSFVITGLSTDTQKYEMDLSTFISVATPVSAATPRNREGADKEPGAQPEVQPEAQPQVQEVPGQPQAQPNYGQSVQPEAPQPQMEVPAADTAPGTVAPAPVMPSAAAAPVMTAAAPVAAPATAPAAAPAMTPTQMPGW